MEADRVLVRTPSVAPFSLEVVTANVATVLAPWLTTYTNFPFGSLVMKTGCDAAPNGCPVIAVGNPLESIE